MVHMNLQLKIYAKSQDSTLQSSAVHADTIAYTLSEDRMMHPLDAQDDILSGYIIYYCMFGYFLIMIFMLNMGISNNTKLLESVSKNISEHFELMSAIFVGFLLVISEFIATAIYFKDITYINGFHIHILSFTLFFMIIRISYLIILVCYKKYKGNFKLKFNFKFFFLVFGYGFLLSLIYIYCYMVCLHSFCCWYILPK